LSPKLYQLLLRNIVSINDNLPGVSMRHYRLLLRSTSAPICIFRMHSPSLCCFRCNRSPLCCT